MRAALRAACLLLAAAAVAQARCVKCNDCATKRCWVRCLKDCPETPDEFMLPGGGLCINMGASQGRAVGEVRDGAARRGAARRVGRQPRRRAARQAAAGARAGAGGVCTLAVCC